MVREEVGRGRGRVIWLTTAVKNAIGAIGDIVEGACRGWLARLIGRLAGRGQMWFIRQASQANRTTVTVIAPEVTKQGGNSLMAPRDGISGNTSMIGDLSFKTSPFPKMKVRAKLFAGRGYKTTSQCAARET